MFLKQAKISRIRLRIIVFIIFLLILSIDLNYSQCVCPPDTTFYTDPEVCTVITDTLMPVSGCSAGPLSYELTGATVKTGDTIINDTFNIGITNIVYTDGTNTCSFKALVKDMEPPNIIGCDDISTVANPGDCGAQVYFDEISIIDNSTLCTGSIIQYHDFKIASIEELTGYGWQFSGFDIYKDDTCLRSNVLISSEAYTVTTPFYNFNSGDTLFIMHWTTGHTTDNDSLIIYLINSASDTVKIFDYECNDTRRDDTIEINYSGFYKILFSYLTDADGSVRGYLDNVYIKAEYAHHDENGSDIPTLPMEVFQLDSTYISGDIFPVGETKIQYKVIDPYGNYTIEEFIVTVTGGENIISGETEVEENSIHLYTTTEGMSDYSWTIEGGIEYGGNDEDSIYVFWSTAGNGTISVEYNDGGTPVTSCELSVTIDEIEYGCFEYKRKLTIDHNLVQADLENFPVLVYDTIPEFKHVSYGGHIAHYNGYDIAFSTDSNGINRIAHQLDCYDPVNGILAVWVLIPDLDGDVNTEFYMHYGNYNINRDISSDTLWSEDFVGVYHMGTDLKDYGRNNNIATNSGTEIINGKIGKARDFVRDENDYITILNEGPFNFTTEMTVTYWIYIESFPTAPDPGCSGSGCPNDWMDIIIKGDNVNWRFVGNRDNQNLYYAFNNGGSPYDIPSSNNSFQAGNWYYIAGTWNSYNDNNSLTNIKRLYINNSVWNTPVPTYNSIANSAINDKPVIFGLNSQAPDTRSLDGILDEVRLSNNYKTDAWIRTDYNTQSNPENFISFGPEKTGMVSSSVGGEVDVLEDTIFAREFIHGELTNYSGSIQWQWSTNNTDFEDIEDATEADLLSEPLLESTYFRALVSNRGCAASSTIDSVQVIAGFIDCEYNYRREIIINPDSVSGTDDFDNFPLLVEIEGNYMRTTGNGGDVENINGYDIIFTSDDGISIIPHEIDTFDGVNGLYRAWVKVPLLKATESTSVFMYYGKTGITQDPSSSFTWSSEYISVWHFNDNYRDTVGLNHGTGSGTLSFNEGIISNSLSFADVNAYLTTPGAYESNFDVPNNGAISISAWININGFNSSDQPLITKGTTTVSWQLRRRESTDNGSFYVNLDLAGDSYWFLASGNEAIRPDWHYICGSYDEYTGATVLYVDGVLASTRNDPGGDQDIYNNNEVLTIGRFNGRLDELRISNVYRSEDWIKTEFRNQNNPQGFYTIWEPRELCTADPDGGTISSDDTVVCIGRNAVIELHNSDGNIYWQESTDSINWQFIRGETDTILITDVLTNTMYYRAVVSESCCSDYSPVIRIDYNDTDPPNVNIYVKNIACAGSDDGIIDIVPQPPVYDYTYYWSNFQTTEDISDLEPGIYSVTIVDNDSKCNLKESREILESERILVTLINLDDVTCSGNDGAIDIAVTGGTLPDVFVFDSIHYIRIEDNDSLDVDISSEGSIEIRFKTGDTLRRGAIIYKGDNDADRSYSMVIDTTTVKFYFDYSGGTHYLSWDSIKINKWYHAAVDWDVNNIILYINGEEKDNSSKTGHNLLNTDDSLYIGKKGKNPSSTKEYFIGNIRDIKIWNRSRLQINIADSMKIPLIGTEPGLLGYWPMNEDGNDSIFNNTPNENIHGVILPASGISWISTKYEYLWSNDSISQDISNQDTGNFVVTVSDAYGCFEERNFYIDFDDAIKVAPSPPELRMQGNRYGEGPVILKVFGPDNNCPDSATRYIWYLEDTQGGQSVQGFGDSLYIPYLTDNQTYYVASVNLPGIESTSRTSVNAVVNDLDSLYRSLYLPNANDYANFGKFDYYEPVNEISIIAWIYMSDMDDGATIIENGWDGSNGVKLYYDATEDSMIFAVNSNTNIVKTSIEEDKWYNIAATYDKQKIKIYINDEIQDSLNYTADISYSTDSLFVGKALRGYIDDVSLWDTALNSNQIKALMFQVLEVCNYDEDMYDGLNMANLRFYSNFDYSNDAENIIISNNFLNNGCLRNNATISNQVPFDNWFPVTDENWHTTSNWYSESLPDSANPGFIVINYDTVELNGTDAKCYGLVLKQNANFNTLNDGSNKLSIFGDIYNADIILNACEVGKVESYSSIELKDQASSDNYSLGNIASNAFQSTVLSKGLRGFYFDDDSFKNILYTSIDTTIDFDYETNSPNSYIDNDGDYSILWCGNIQSSIDGGITFYLTTEGISNLYVNDSLIISSESTSFPFENSGIINLTASQWYVLILTYSENSGSGSVSLEWEYSGQSRQFIPAEYLRPFTGTIE